jgi:hypothetical protein
MSLNEEATINYMSWESNVGLIHRAGVGSSKAVEGSD